MAQAFKAWLTKPEISNLYYTSYEKWSMEKA